MKPRQITVMAGERGTRQALTSVAENIKEIDELRRLGVRAPLGMAGKPSIGLALAGTSGSGFRTADGLHGWAADMDRLTVRAPNTSQGCALDVGPNGTPDTASGTLYGRVSTWETDPTVTDDITRFDMLTDGTVHRLRAYKSGAGSFRDTVFDKYDGTTVTEYARFVASSGNYGLGTSSPAGRFHVVPAGSDEAIVVTGYSLTGSSAVAMLDLAGTWNTSGTPTAILLTMTDTASNAASLLEKFVVGATTMWKVAKDGTPTAQANYQWYSGTSGSGTTTS